MRLLWAILALLLVGGGAAAFLQSGRSPSADAGSSATVAASGTRDARTALQPPDLLRSADPAGAVEPTRPEAAADGGSNPSPAVSADGVAPDAGVEAAEGASTEMAENAAQAGDVAAGSEVDPASVDHADSTDAASQDRAAVDTSAVADMEPFEGSGELAADAGETVSETAPEVAPAPETEAAPTADGEANEQATDRPTEEAAASETASGGWSALADDLVDEGAAAPAKPADAAPAISVEHREDGRIVIDGRFVVTGKGTAEEPFVLPWDLLVSVERVYNPREGQRTLPAWLELFDGQVVKVRGFLLLPVMADEVTELLLMRNQWDGCCIGIPPTAYDAVEVKLATEARMSSLDITHGDIVGTFDVDPYLSGNWLIGLYLMEDARVVAGSDTGRAP
ncbi:MAG: hypothetical protein ACF8SC_05465 [Phycisphaerales bacterium JB037]